jgi:flavin reductase (DIM6/NTAB) family NADH-FMN oxidoreductase RutF
MTIDLFGEHADRAFPILSSLVVPRPIAWITTLNENGTVNAAPFSFFGLFGSKPPLVIFTVGDRPEGGPKDTARNAERTGEFVVHTVDEDLGGAMVGTAAALPYGESEPEAAGLETVASKVVAVPRLAAAPVALECRVHSIQRIGQNRLVLGTVVSLELRDELFDPETRRVVQEKYRPIGRMGAPSWYCRSGDRFEMEVPG